MKEKTNNVSKKLSVYLNEGAKSTKDSSTSKTTNKSTSTKSTKKSSSEKKGTNEMTDEIIEKLKEIFDIISQDYESVLENHALIAKAIGGLNNNGTSSTKKN
ncbi:MAG: hypothetical protein N3A54_04770 [Patescibacteria group bacterium]|nr:hypothetical protein [Patescibacteria group bacterium]